MFPEVDLPLVAGAPRPPSFLNAQAKREFRRLAALLTGAGILTEPALGPLAVLCALHADIANAWKRGASPTAAMIAQYRSLCSDFAMTPASRSRATPVGIKPAAGANPFERNGQRVRVES
jgi:phage terminase small subunit